MITRAAASHLDGASIRTLFEQSGDAKELAIDLSVVVWVDLAAMPVLLASFASRSRMNRLTRIKLPNDDRILEFLEAWNFFECLYRWTGTDLERMLDPEGLRRLRAVQKPEGNRYRTDLLPRYSLPLIEIPVDRSRPLHAAASERDRWLDGPVQSVLRKTIGADASKYVAWAVFEGIKNTAMHSDAKLVYTTAEYQSSNLPGTSNEFTVCIWDNGESFADTLRQGLSLYESIVTPTYGRVAQELVIELSRTRGEKPDSLALRAGDGFTLRAKDGVPISEGELEKHLAFTLAAFFLGVTSDPRPRLRDVASGDELVTLLTEKGLAGADRHGGLGTYLILDTVVFACAGMVEYYSGPYHVTFTHTNIPDRYHTEVEAVATGSGAQGNLLVLRFPGSDPAEDRGAPV